MEHNVLAKHGVMKVFRCRYGSPTVLDNARGSDKARSVESLSQKYFIFLIISILIFISKKWVIP